MYTLTPLGDHHNLWLIGTLWSSRNTENLHEKQNRLSTNSYMGFNSCIYKTNKRQVNLTGADKPVSGTWKQVISNNTYNRLLKKMKATIPPKVEIFSML